MNKFFDLIQDLCPVADDAWLFTRGKHEKPKQGKAHQSVRPISADRGLDVALGLLTSQSSSK